MNHDEWLNARKEGIGASDAAAVIGVSPYKTNVELWEEKTGRREAEDISGKPFVEYGKKAEAYLRGLFQLEHPEYIVDYDEFGRVANLPECPWLFATLDGELSELDNSKPMQRIRRKGVLEIKTTEIMRSSQWDGWRDKVPQHYYIQMLHQLLATQYDFVTLMAQIKAHDRNGETYFLRKFYYLERAGAQDDLLFLLEKEKDFWTCVMSGSPPPLLLPEI